MKIFSAIGKFFNEMHQDGERRRAAYINKYALSCRQCRRLAPPILGTGNRYRCECGNQFAGARHDLTEQSVR